MILVFLFIFFLFYKFSQEARVELTTSKSDISLDEINSNDYDRDLKYGFYEDMTKEEKLEHVLDRLNNKENKAIQEMSLEDAFYVVEKLKLYLEEDFPKLRHFTYKRLKEISLNQNNESLNQLVVYELLKAINDSSALVWQHAAADLIDYSSNDFNDKSKLLIQEYISKEKHLAEVFLIAGCAGIIDILPLLDKIIGESTDVSKVGMWYGSLNWRANLAAARLGAKRNIKYCIKKIENEPNDVIRVTKLLRDLAYIRQKESVLSIKSFLDSDDRLPSVKDGVLGSSYSQCAIDLLSEIIYDFPIEKKFVGGYSSSDISTARLWMNQKRNWVDKIIR